jgi:hypothetical protein
MSGLLGITVRQVTKVFASGTVTVKTVMAVLRCPVITTTVPGGGRNGVSRG